MCGELKRGQGPIIALVSLYMQKVYAEKIELEKFAQEVVDFFEVRKFGEIAMLHTDRGYQVIAGDSSVYKIRSDLRVDVRRSVKGFSVSFDQTKETKRFNYPMMLATMFGGGYFFLRDLKSDESWRKIEREFWVQTASMITKAKTTLDSSQQQNSEHSEL